MSFLKKLWANLYFRHLLYAVAGFFLIVFLLNMFLNLFTRHGQSFAVPDFKEMSIESARAVAKKEKLQLVIVDSVFVHSFPRGTIFEQNPKAGVQVKKNRKVFLTMNLMSPKKVPMPNVVNYSLRQAKAELTAKGFYVGSLQYVPYDATNLVIDQKYNGNSISEGMMLPMYSYIDLVLGLNSMEGSTTTTVPNVVGLSYTVARDLIIENSLNIGALHFDVAPKNISDTLDTKVYKQVPSSSSANYIQIGSKVELFLKPDNQ